MHTTFENNWSNVMIGFRGENWDVSRLVQVALRENR